MWIDSASNVKDSNSLYKLGKIHTDKGFQDLFEVVVGHPYANLYNIAYVSIGNSISFPGQIRFFKTDVKGVLELYYDKNTMEYFIKPTVWSVVYINQIRCINTPTFEEVPFDDAKHILLK